MRRGAALAALALVAAGALGARAAPARAQASAMRWSGTWDQASGFVSDVESLTLSGTVTYNHTPTTPDDPPAVKIDALTLDVDFGGDALDGCLVPAPQQIDPLELDPNPEPPDPTLDPSFNETVAFTSSAFALNCNGPYVATLVAHASGASERPEYTFVMELPFAVGAPPEAVAGVTAALDGRTVGLSWSPVYQSPDFQGYVIERAAGTGGFSAVGGVFGSTTTWDDTRVPDAGGPFSYRVRAARSGPAGSGDLVFSAEDAATPVTVTVPPAPAPSTTSTTRPPVPTTRGGIASHTTPAPARRASTAATVDPGYNPTLDYSDIEPGEPDAVLPSDGSMLQRFVDDPQQQRALLVPTAGALLLVAWAMHLRFLTRQSRS